MYLVQTMFLELHNLKFKVCSHSILVKLDPAGEPVDLDHLHVVDQRVAVLPGVVIVAAERAHGHHLGHVEVCQGGGEQSDRIIEQSRVRLDGDQVGGGNILL